MTHVLVLQHEPGEDLGTLAPVLAAAGLEARVVQSFAGEPVPAALGEAAGLVVLGGGMAVYEQDRLPFLRDELRLLEDALRVNAPVLGICLGSQLLAAALGATVTKADRQEIGWHEVRLEEAARADPLWARSPASFVAFHWHGDTHALPRGATLLAASDLCATQAFRHGEAWGVQFHPEVDERVLQAMASSGGKELASAKLSAQDLLGALESLLLPMQAAVRPMFVSWAARAATGAAARAAG